LANHYKFNKGTELNNDFDINLYETQCRLYDPQVGRFWQVDELAEANWEWTPYNFALNNPISFNDPLGLQEEKKPDPDKPVVTEKTNMQGVTVIGHVKPLTKAQVQDFHTRLENAGISIDNVKSSTYRRQLERYDAVYNFMKKVHEGTREQDKIVLEIASFFVPVAWITKLRYVKAAVNLLKFKRGAAVVGAARTTILGRMGRYLKAAEEMGYNKFVVKEGEKWTWEANEKFLSEAVVRGDEVILTQSAHVAEEGSVFKREIEYLLDKGYNVAKDGMSLYKLK
jgi:RHS repeat-associated protein